MTLPSTYFVDQQFKYSKSIEEETRVYKYEYLAGILVRTQPSLTSWYLPILFGGEFISLLITGRLTYLVYCYVPWSGSKAKGKMIRS